MAHEDLTLVVLNTTRALRQPLSVKRCTSFYSRLRGFMFAKPPDPENGLLFLYSRMSRIDPAIHMLFVPFQLLILWLDSHYRVVDVHLAKPWELYYFPIAPAQYVIEVHADRIEEFLVGDRLQLSGKPG